MVPLAFPAEPVLHWDFNAMALVQVVRVTAGDSLVIDLAGKPTKARLACVRAPGTHQRYGLDSLVYLRNALRGEQIWMRYDWGSTPAWDGDRLVIVAFRFPDATWMNLETVKLGTARFRHDEPCRYADLFAGYEQRAKRTRKGLWALE